MKRKTNLFYIGGNADSKFLTFSNYGELVTGNFLSTDTKLFPSMFLCLNIPSLTAETKDSFIKEVLISKYENRLAFLRDCYLEDGKLPESVDTFKPLDFLLHDIFKKYTDAVVTYVGVVNESDYNGSYADIICIVNGNEMGNASVTVTDGTSTIANEDESLHGWSADELPTAFSSLTGDESITEDDAVVVKVQAAQPSTEANRTFNILIPLCSLCNTADNDNPGVILDDGLISSYNVNVPLGIWFADKAVTLSAAENYAQSWSLVIGAQFKPFPASNAVSFGGEAATAAEEFSAFAKVLAKLERQIAENETVKKELDDLKTKVGQYHN